MIDIVNINGNIGIDCKYLSSKIIRNYLYFLTLLKKYTFIPTFKYVKNKQLFIIIDDCILLNQNTISNNDIINISKIIPILKKHSIKLNYLLNIPILKNSKTGTIYFVNFMYSTNQYIKHHSSTLLSTTVTNYYVLKTFCNDQFDLDINYIKNINIMVLILNIDYSDHGIYKLFNQINKLYSLTLNITFVLILIDDNYNNIKTLLENETSCKFFLIRAPTFDFKYAFYITLLELQKYTFDFLYIKCITTHCLNLNTIIGNIYNKTPNNIYIKYKNYYKKTELISFKKRYSMLYNSIKLNFKDFFDYTIDDIDRSTLNIRSNIKYILKNIVTNKITYDFKNKQYPIKINLMNTIINQTTLKKIFIHAACLCTT